MPQVSDCLLERPMLHSTKALLHLIKYLDLAIDQPSQIIKLSTPHTLYPLYCTETTKSTTSLLGIREILTTQTCTISPSLSLKHS